MPIREDFEVRGCALPLSISRFSRKRALLPNRPPPLARSQNLQLYATDTAPNFRKIRAGSASGPHRTRVRSTPDSRKNSVGFALGRPSPPRNPSAAAAPARRATPDAAHSPDSTHSPPCGPPRWQTLQLQTQPAAPIRGMALNITHCPDSPHGPKLNPPHRFPPRPRIDPPP